MAIISLRAYNREIEGMIDNSQLDEAVAHCRHILATFPKHIATYRLIGKAHLEQQRISDATDIFQRVLSAIPDDFVSNVGMSIIREDENNLDAAIWHMELAYEAQPANAAIQDELRRLYGRRDGMQPPRVRLTRGALARMYAKGGLYDQAIAELRAAITEDPNRPDLQLLLAQMLYQTAQRVDAVDTCVNILKKIPLCLEANRILAISLPDAENSETVRNSRQLVVSMDPYYAFAEPEAISSEEVAENAVTIERLDYKSGIQATEIPEQPAWATSLGISMEKQADENIPEWLKAVEAPSATTSTEKPAQGVSPFIWDTQEVEKIITDTSKPEGEMPDWMKDAGWAPATGESQPVPSITEPQEVVEKATEVDENLVQADIPEWLRGIAPNGFMGTQGQQLPTEGEKLSNPWLEPHQPGPTDSIIHWLEEEKPVSATLQAPQKENIILPAEDEMPDWLKDIEVPAEADKGLPGEVGTAAAFTAGLAAFLEEADKPIEAEAVPTTTGLPVESAAVIAPVEAGLQPNVEAIETEPAALPSTEEELPDWLKDLSTQAPEENLPLIPDQPSAAEFIPSQGETVPPAAIPADKEPAQAESEAGPDALKMAGAVLAAEMLTHPGEKPAEEPVIQEQPAESAPTGELPSVVAGTVIAETPLAPASTEPQAAEEAPSAAQPLPVEAEILPAEPEVTSEPEAFAWLKGLEDEQETQAEELVAPGPEGEIPPPEWVTLEKEPVTDETVLAEPTQATEQPAAAPEETPDWIMGLGDETESTAPTVETAPEPQPSEEEPGKEEELPAWLVEMEQPEPEKEAAGATEEPLEWEPEELPAWLKEITETEQPEEAIPDKEIETEKGPSIPGVIAAAALGEAIINKEEPAAEVPVETIPQPIAEVPEPQIIIPEIPIQPVAQATTEPEVQAPTEIQAAPEAVAAEEPITAQAPVDTSAEVSAQTTLTEARTAITNGEPAKAVSCYSNLIKQNFFLDDIIKDIQEALYRYPVDPEMWVTLGDAHSQTKDLQEALNAYTRAEELVR